MASCESPLFKTLPGHQDHQIFRRTEEALQKGSFTPRLRDLIQRRLNAGRKNGRLTEVSSQSLARFLRGGYPEQQDQDPSLRLTREMRKLEAAYGRSALVEWLAANPTPTIQEPTDV